MGVRNKIKYFINYNKFKIYCKKHKSKVIKPLIITNPKYIQLENNIRVKDGARIECYTKFAGKKLTPQLNIKENVIIGYNFSCLVADKITIEKNTILASNVLITSENHSIDPENIIPYHEQPLLTGTVSIGEGCWIGEKVVILPNVNIGKKCVIAAGAVVTKNIPDYSIAGGIPAKVIKRYDFEKHEWILCKD